MSFAVSTISAPAVASDVPQEIAAAISAAVHTLYPGAKVSSIRRRNRNRRNPKQSAWKMAGLLESTDPF